MLRTVSKSKKIQLSIGKKENILSLILSILSLTWLATPAKAQLRRVGVVKSPENVNQWTEIEQRLKATGIDYCILDSSKWQETADLNTVRVLLLPNVEKINGAQAIALEAWMKSGGRVIVTGPTGNLSQRDIQEKLKELFGAFWGFPISRPTNLSPQLQDQEWLNQQNLSAMLIGGAVIPAGVESETAAIWLGDGSPPAVVVTENSTFLGWRWGVDRVAPLQLDTAWFQAALSRYGIGRDELSFNSLSGNPCNPSQQEEEIRPLFPLEQSQKLPEELSNNGQEILPEEFQKMTQEIEGLIQRVESILLTADAQTIDLANGQSQFIGDKNSEIIPVAFEADNKNNKNYQALIEVSKKHKRFIQFYQQKDYYRARHEWKETREIILENYPTEQLLAASEIRAIWLDRGTIVKAKSEADLVKIFDRFAASGINTVFFETINASYPIYPSKIAPEQNPLTKGWDPLKAAVKLAHERGMELHAWVWIFAAANQQHNVILNKPIDDLGPVLSQRRDWAMTDKQGGFFDYNSNAKKAFFDPANPEVQQYLLGILNEIVTNYEVDGVQLDYIRYPFQDPNANKTFGYSRESRRKFKNLSGVDPININPDHPLWHEWTKFRIQQVDKFVGRVHTMLKNKRPELIISAAVFPLERQERLSKIQQNWEGWMQVEWIDAIVPMTYANNSQELNKIAAPLFSENLELNTIIIPGIRLLNVPDMVAVDQMQLLRNLPTGGYALFAAENFTDNLQEIFSNKKVQESTPLPTRQPFTAAVYRYQDLQKEWIFLLRENQISMSNSDIKEWGKKADLLGESLNRLATQPSTRNLLSAQISLSSFQQEFDDWMAEHREVKPYQVEVWKNRLKMLEGLLSYGERIVKQNQPEIAEK